ncbi:hypothetical protein G9A89_020542 [Geosiphon pyriformis]|nr:hypothetical protein G9A89_020542 [Geosiphon pyriformis]
MAAHTLVKSIESENFQSSNTDLDPSDLHSTGKHHTIPRLSSQFTTININNNERWNDSDSDLTITQEPNYLTLTLSNDIEETVEVMEPSLSDTQIGNQYEEFQCDPKTKLPISSRIIGFCSLSLAIFVVSLDQTILATSISRKNLFSNSSSNLIWINTIYLLMSVASQPLFEKISAILGRKSMFLLAMLIFLIGSSLCGASQNTQMLILSRGISGFGSGGILSLYILITSDIVPVQSHGKYHGLIQDVYVLGTVIGPFIGGIFLEYTSWRWEFYLNILIGSLTISLIFVLWYLSKIQDSVSGKLKNIDFLGITILFLGILAIVFPLIWGGNKYEWDSVFVIMLFCTGVVLLLGFILVESFFASEPIIPLHLFKIRNYLVIFIFNLLLGLNLIVFIFYLPIYFEFVKGYSIMRAGLQIYPLLLGYIPLSLIGFTTSRTPYFRPWMATIGFAMIAFAADSFSRFNQHSSTAAIFGFQFLAGAGLGCSLQTSLITAHNAAINSKDIPLITSVIVLFRTIGSSLGIVIAGAVYNFEMNSRELAISHENESFNIYKSQSESDKDLEAYTEALNKVFFMAMISSCIATIIGLFITSHHKTESGKEETISDPSN